MFKSLKKKNKKIKKDDWTFIQRDSIKIENYLRNIYSHFHHIIFLVIIDCSIVFLFLLSMYLIFIQSIYSCLRSGGYRGLLSCIGEF